MERGSRHSWQESTIFDYRIDRGLSLIRPRLHDSRVVSMAMALHKQRRGVIKHVWRYIRTLQRRQRRAVSANVYILVGPHAYLRSPQPQVMPELAWRGHSPKPVSGIPVGKGSVLCCFPNISPVQLLAQASVCWLDFEELVEILRADRILLVSNFSLFFFFFWAVSLFFLQNFRVRIPKAFLWFSLFKDLSPWRIQLTLLSDQ